MQYPAHLLKLIQVLKRFPGVGNKSAERFAFHLLTWSQENLKEVGEAISSTRDLLKQCHDCGCLVDGISCPYCDLSKRDYRQICVVASPREVFSIDGTREYRGLFHVLGGLLSPLQNRGPEHLSLRKLKERITELGIQELVIALDSTLEGDATALYLKEELSRYPVHISRLAFGLPLGSSLEYVDGGTLARAMSARNRF